MEKFLIALLVLFLSIPLVLRIIYSVNNYISEKNYLYEEINRAENEKEREHWINREKYHRLTLFPFINGKIAERIYNIFHSKNK